MIARSESSPPFPWRMTLIQFGLSIPILLVLPVVAAAITGWFASPLYGVGDGHPVWRIVFWSGAAPLIYTVWLVVFLVLCAVDVQSRRWYRGLKKVPRVTTADGFTKFFPVITLYLRMRFVYSLPLVHAFLIVPGLRWLVLWSYSTSAHLGPESRVLGVLLDPDLAFIGPGAVIGSDASIVSHSVTTQTDGTLVLVTAPIVIGARAVIGGGSLVALGATIGEDSFVEPLSSVMAYTQIPPGEVWGGNPAVFRRRRHENEDHSIARRFPTPDASLERQVCHAVATALRLPTNEVTPTFSCDDCAEWDSLGQMAVASTLHSVFGLEIPMEQCFRLRSVSQIVDYLASRQVLPTNNMSASLPDDPELLPLLDHRSITRKLSERDRPNHFPTVKVLVAATFSMEPIASSLTLWSSAFGIPVELESVGFNQVPQALLSPDSPFRRNTSGINVVLTRVEDLLADGGDRSVSLLAAIRQIAGEFPHLLVVANLPPVVASDCSIDRSVVQELRKRWDQSLAEIAGIQVIDFAQIVESIGTTAAANPEGERIAAVPYSAEVYSELGIAIARNVRARRVPARKVLALDADGVLWGKVLAEEGIDGIQLEQGDRFQQLQQVALRLKARGVLLALVSRNALLDVQQVFESHSGMVLRSGDIAAWRVNWQPKSQNLREIARELNVGLDSIVFVDDDLANQLEVQAELPQVTVIPLISSTANPGQLLDRLWSFDSLGTTEIDSSRTEMVLREQVRQRLREGVIDLKSYLASLELQAVMRVATDSDMPRVAQLTQKTNQFNLSLKRRSETELVQLRRDYEIFVIEVKDRLGDYGLVGVCILKRPVGAIGTVEVDSFLVSCRALARGVEEAALYGMVDVAKSWGGDQLEAELVVGPRNEPMQEFLQRVGFERTAHGGYRLSVDSEVTFPSHIHWTGPIKN